MKSKEKLAILGGVPEFTDTLPIYNSIGQEEIDAAVVVMKSGVLSGFIANAKKEFLGGENILALEEAFCNRFGSAYAVSVNSATSGLHAALASLDISLDDEVIVPPYSMSASATSIVMCGAKPVFVDIEESTFCIDPEKIIEAITPKTKAIMSVNLFGQPSDLGILREIANKHNLYLIEDNSQAPAAKYYKNWAGTIGDIGVFSLNRHKTMQCGEGGVVVCNDPVLAHKLRMIRNHGEAILQDVPEKDWKPGDENIIGYNYRLTSLQAAIALSQINKLDILNKARIDLANYLSERLDEFNFLDKAVIRENCTHVYYLYPMIYNSEKTGISRDIFLAALQAEGAPVSNYGSPLYRLPLYKNRFGNENYFLPENFPVVEKLWKDKMIITSICRPPLTKKHIDQLIAAIHKVFKNRNNL